MTEPVVPPELIAQVRAARAALARLARTPAALLAVAAQEARADALEALPALLTQTPFGALPDVSVAGRVGTPTPATRSRLALEPPSSPGRRSGALVVPPAAAHGHSGVAPLPPVPEHAPPVLPLAVTRPPRPAAAAFGRPATPSAAARADRQVDAPDVPVAPSNAPETPGGANSVDGIDAGPAVAAVAPADLAPLPAALAEVRRLADAVLAAGRAERGPRTRIPAPPEAGGRAVAPPWEAVSGGVRQGVAAPLHRAGGARSAGPVRPGGPRPGSARGPLWPPEVEDDGGPGAPPMAEPVPVAREEPVDRAGEPGAARAAAGAWARAFSASSPETGATALDPAELAALVNEALVAQARRQGVDLS